MPDPVDPTPPLPTAAASAFLRVLALVVVGITIGRSGSQGFGATGSHLAVTLAFAVAAVAWMAGQVPRHRGGPTVADGRPLRPGDRWYDAARLAVVGLCGGVLAGLAPATVGAAFAFVAVIGAALRLRLRDAVGVTAVTFGALGVAFAFGDQGAGALAGYTLGLLVALLGSYNTLQYRVRSRQATQLAVETERATGEEARAARLDERSRIAREIHDVLAHSMAALSIQLEAAHLLAERTTGGERDRLLAHLERARMLTRDGLDETRQALGTLRGDPLPLASLLGELAAGYRADTGSPVTVAVDGDPSALRPDVTLAVLRVAQEALTNTRRHGGGSPVSVDLCCGHDGTVLRVADHVEHRGAGVAPVPGEVGDGCDPLAGAAGRPSSGAAPGPSGSATPGPSGGGAGPAATGGYGLVGMRERAALLGGSLVAGPAGRGWVVELRLPA